MTHRPPNIIFLMTDQHRFDALGCVNPLVRTPNIDRLTSQGVRFAQATCNVPACMPSRHSMMTGLYAFQSGFRHNTSQAITDAALPVPLLPQRLRELGYQTAGFGKTHWWDTQGVPKPTPSTRGFEVRAIARQRESDEYEPGALMWDDDDPTSCTIYEREVATWGRGQGSVEALQGQQSVLSPMQTREGWLTRQAMRFVDEGRDAARPLFLYLSFDYPHAGFNMPDGPYESWYDLDAIPDRPLDLTLDPAAEHAGTDSRFDAWQQLSPQQRRLTTLRYYALCSYVDDLFGMLIKKLEQHGELENSLIVFLSDHGEMLGDRRHMFDKHCLYEGSVRVPLMLAGSSVPAEMRGSVDDRPAELVDVLPTLIDVAGGEAPACLPGRSLLGPPCRKGQFAERHGRGYEPQQRAQTLMWRCDGWKLILHTPTTASEAMLSLDLVRGELYDLSGDPTELNNRYQDPTCRDQREQMTRDLLMHQTGAACRYPVQVGKPALVLV